MKLYNLKAEKLKDFFEIVKKCKGNVYLISPDMRLNLKSNLSHYVSFTSLCTANESEIQQIEIVASDRDDVDMLYKFMIEEER